MESGYVYILSNSRHKGVLKIGRTTDNPSVRAKHLSRQTGALGIYNVEWSKNVPHLALAEAILHYKFHPHSLEKEFFRLPLNVAIHIAEDVLDKVFLPKIEKQSRVPKREKEFWLFGSKPEQEKETGILFTPVGENTTVTWDEVIPKLSYSFGKRAIKLCLREGKRGDPLRKRFISYRNNFYGFKSLHLMFRKNFISVYITADKQMAKSIVGDWFSEYEDVDLATWDRGISLKIRTNKQFEILQSWLQMGKKRIIEIAKM